MNSFLEVASFQLQYKTRKTPSSTAAISAREFLSRARHLIPSKVPISTFLNQLDTGDVRRVDLTPTTISYKSGKSANNKCAYSSSISKIIVQKLIQYNIPFSFKPDSLRNLIFSKAWVWAPLAISAYLGISALSPSDDAGKFKFASFEDRSHKTVSFDAVKGIGKAKDELVEIVNMIHSPAKYIQMGAKVPRGVLMVGPPGTGKTLLARATANAVDLPFIYANGSDFVEVYAGRGASRIRNLFLKAQSVAPSILFIDEIDSIGKRRFSGRNDRWSSNAGDVHDEEYVQTLNAFLSSLDGMDTAASEVLVMGATNRFSVLDEALIRPGRFDRIVKFELPGVEGRREILELYSEKTEKMDPTVDLQQLAEDGEGLSPADLELLVNEAALHAVRHNHDRILHEDFEHALDLVLTRKTSNETFDFSKQDSQ